MSIGITATYLRPQYSVDPAPSHREYAERRRIMETCSPWEVAKMIDDARREGQEFTLHNGIPHAEAKMLAAYQILARGLYPIGDDGPVDSLKAEKRKLLETVAREAA